MANAESREVDDDPFFYRACLRYDIDPSRGSYLASTDLSEWSSDDLCRVLQKTHGPTATADIVSRPYFWQRQNWVRPPKDLIQRAAEEKMALCTNRSGEWDARADGYFAISDVWAEGLYADPSNRGLPRAVIEQVFEMIKPLDVEWIWLDSLSVPGGRRYLSFEEELVREKLINNMGSIYRGAVAVVVFDRLTMSLASQDPINVGITLLFSRWFSRIWTLQEAKLASRVLILTKVGFTDLFHDIVEPLKNTGNFPHEKSKIDQLRTTLSRLVSSRGLPTSLHELVLLSAHRKARNDLDFSRALYACLGLDWIETFNEEQSTNYILENHKEEATQLLGMHGSPLLRNGYSWAPLRFRGLKGKFISGLEWEENGIRGDWCSYRVRTSHERRSASLPRESVLELELESDPLDTVVTVSCALSSEERPETIQGFKDAICDTRALLLSHNALDWIKNPVQRGSRQTVLLTRNEDSANEAFIFMTAGVITCDKPALTHEESWLIYHRSPLSNPLDSSIGDLALLEGQITELCRLGLEARLTRLDAERFASVQSAVDTFMANGMTAIHIVCTTGDVDALRILLDAGASIEMREKHFGMTPLQIAVAAQRIECVAALIDREARPNFASSSGQQPLALAVMHRNLRIVRLLVVAGANVDIVNERNGRTPLHTAVGMNNAAVVKVLLECDDAEGALGRADENGYQPYWLAVQDPDGDVLALIASKWSVGQEFVDNVRRWHRFWHVVAPCALSFSIPLALVLDIASLLLAHRGELISSSDMLREYNVIGHRTWMAMVLLSGYWSKWVPVIVWQVDFFIRPGCARYYEHVQAIDHFHWTTDTIFLSRLLPPLLWLASFTLRRLLPFYISMLASGGLFHYYRRQIVGRQLYEEMRSNEAGRSPVTRMLIVTEGFVITSCLTAGLYLCRLVGWLLSLPTWHIILHCALIVLIGTVNTICFRPQLIGEVGHLHLRRYLPIRRTVMMTLSLGITQWIFLVLFYLTYCDSLLGGEILLVRVLGYSGEYVHTTRLLLLFPIGFLCHTLTQTYHMDAELLRRMRAIQQNLGWGSWIFAHSLMGAMVYAPVVAAFSVLVGIVNNASKTLGWNID